MMRGIEDLVHHSVIDNARKKLELPETRSKALTPRLHMLQLVRLAAQGPNDLSTTATLIKNYEVTE